MVFISSCSSRSRLGFRGSFVFISFGLRLNVRTTGAHFILHQSDQPSLGFSYVDVPQRCRVAPRFQIVLRFVQDLTPILERFAIDLYATLRIEIRHRHLRSSVYVRLSLSEDVKNMTTQSAAYSISFLNL